jgi:hypothetical protein
MIWEICMLEKEKERERGGKERLGPNLEQTQGISFFQSGKERDMAEVGLG